MTHRLEAAKGRVLHVEHSLRFTHLFLTALAVTLFLFPALAHAEADEPQVRIETLPRWQSATLNIYIFGMPSDGAELTQTSIILRVAVWGATEDDPLIIQLDGDVAARITYDGLSRLSGASGAATTCSSGTGTRYSTRPRSTSRPRRRHP